jgi:hypothetical protein
MPLSNPLSGMMNGVWSISSMHQLHIVGWHQETKQTWHLFYLTLSIIFPSNNFTKKTQTGTEKVPDKNLPHTCSKNSVEAMPEAPLQIAMPLTP